jgi:hypothetical protein
VWERVRGCEGCDIYGGDGKGVRVWGARVCAQVWEVLIVTGIPTRTHGVENEPKNIQIRPEMKEI